MTSTTLVMISHRKPCRAIRTRSGPIILTQCLMLIEPIQLKMCELVENLGEFLKNFMFSMKTIVKISEGDF